MINNSQPTAWAPENHYQQAEKNQNLEKHLTPKRLINQMIRQLKLQWASLNLE